MRILWICGLPLAVQRKMLPDENHLPLSAWSWILAHLPPAGQVDLHIACLWAGGSRRTAFPYEGATFHLVPCPRRGRAALFFLRDPSYFRALFDEIKPDVVHGWGTEDSFGMVARRLAPRRHVIGIQGLITAYRSRVQMERRTLLTAVTERWTLRKARWVVAESGYSITAARPHCPNAQTRVIEHPLREDFLTATPSDGRSPRILFLGSISERKGISDALRAFAAIPGRDWGLHVVGSGTPQAEAEMFELVEQLGIRGRFRHDQSLAAPAIIVLMQSSAVFLLPTRIDTGPTALKEALALGLWPVCYDNTGPGEYVRQFGFGTLARDLDLEDLTFRLREVTESRPWLDQSRRQALFSATRTAFSRERIWGELTALYREVCSGS